MQCLYLEFLKFLPKINRSQAPFMFNESMAMEMLHILRFYTITSCCAFIILEMR